MKKPEYLKLANSWAEYWGQFVNDLFSNKHNEAGLCLVQWKHRNVNTEVEAVQKAVEECGVATDDGHYWFKSRAHRVNFLLLLAAQNGEL